MLLLILPKLLTAACLIYLSESLSNSLNTANTSSAVLGFTFTTSPKVLTAASLI
nr:hypothetical protein [Rickettsia felis]